MNHLQCDNWLKIQVGGEKNPLTYKGLEMFLKKL